jgi:signal recognition particle subunit SRP54
MKALEQKIKPDEIVMVIDGTIGQQALVQAKSFHEATPIGAILVTKLDGSARGGGALSAVAATGAPIKFIGTGEKIEDIEAFIPSRFVGRLLGMGDLETLLEKVKEAEIKVPQKKAKAILSGKFTLTDMYEQFEAVKGMGPFRKVLQMLPGMSAKIPDEMLNTAEGRLEKWRVIIQSMRPEEKDNPKMFNSSRIKRVARGSGTTEKDVKELLKQYVMMRKMMKMFKRKKKLPFNLGQGFPADFK